MELLEKIRLLEASSLDIFVGTLVNPTGNFHLPVKFFLGENEFSDDYILWMLGSPSIYGLTDNLGK
jgi:hypothetical protein